MGGQVGGAAREGDGQAPGGRDGAEQDVGERGAPFGAGVPGLDDGADVVVGPGEIERAAGEDRQHRRLAEGDDLLQQRVLQAGEPEVGLVAGRLRVAGVALLALDVGREPQAEHDGVGARRRR